MHMVQFDIQTAFLYGLIDVVIYMLQLPGFEISGSDGEPLVCLVLKSLYGLKQSGRIWNKTFSNFLTAFELEATIADPYVFISRNEPTLILTLFVDDGLAYCVSLPKLEALISHMESHFSITRSKADLYVGLHIHRDEAKKLIFVNQAIYLQHIIAKFGFEGCTPLSTPADPNVKLNDTVEPSHDAPYSYSSAVGSLMFVQTLSRPDISYAVNSAAKFTSHPQRAHYVAVNRIFRYLVGTLNLAICYDGNKGTNTLAAYADADYASDITDRKSRTGTLVLLNDAPISWCSRKQACVATSTTEAEYIVANSITKDVIWLRQLLQNLRFSQPHPTGLFSDNQSTIHLVHNPEFH
jgi:hypothetical protein